MSTNEQLFVKRFLLVFGDCVWEFSLLLHFFMKILRISINKNLEIIVLCSVMYTFRL